MQLRQEMCDVAPIYLGGYSMARRKVGSVKKSGSQEVTKILSYLIEKNGFVGENDLLISVFSGETESLKPTKLGVSAWGYIHKSTIIHRTSKLGSSRITDCYLKDTDGFLPEND